ncbi:hypothetical protein [Stygiolobus caldivivus]|uniref:Uncharacterized protein n=1 Tax=Stygiolobus caldivivus TaxID=2824673 RepID=A0A8D5ZI02_9CREN|nr:hypothetical protein [Stygiolobus caldivivus]BCU68867.1 hypothetical protein KN1_01640 [Stygiolobus caldivivus]
MELEKSMIKRFSFSPTSMSYMLGMMLLDSIGLYFALNGVKNIDAGIIWYSVAILLLVASLATGFSITLVYHSSALAYYVRFSKLRMANYILSVFTGSLVSTILYSVAFTGLVTPLITKVTLGKLYEILSLSNVIPFIVSTAISSLFILSLTFTIISSLLVKLGAKASNYAYYIFFAFLALSDLSPSASSEFNPFYEAANVISYSLIHDSLSVYCVEVLLLALLLLAVGSVILKRIKALRLEEVVW